MITGVIFLFEATTPVKKVLRPGGLETRPKCCYTIVCVTLKIFKLDTERGGKYTPLDTTLDAPEKLNGTVVHADEKKNVLEYVFFSIRFFFAKIFEIH